MYTSYLLQVTIFINTKPFQVTTCYNIMASEEQMSLRLQLLMSPKGTRTSSAVCFSMSCCCLHLSSFILQYLCLWVLSSF